MTLTDDHHEAIVRHVERFVADPPESEDFAAGVRAGLEAAALVLDDAARSRLACWRARARPSLLLRCLASNIRKASPA